ncbi:hypothetical protein LEN26_018858 [Aphanomyces euteiches]|nr:hypothetical protein LEN26_018858 [Aphanomyces euteiches]
MEQANKVYFMELKRFMHFLGRSCELNDPNFSSASLTDVTPEDVRRYFNVKAFGTPNPAPNSLPTHARSNTLKAMKKMLSSFMPRRMIPWDEIRREGNPTRSTTVNDVIKYVMKCEVRKQGVATKARRPIEFTEFLNALKIIRQSDEFSEIDRYRLGSIITLQWHLIARVDDMMKLRVGDFSFNPNHHFTLLCQMRWSKNITEEREAPRQIILGSMDDRLCPLLNLAIYLETQLTVMDSDSFLYGNGGDGHRNVRSLLSVALEHCDFNKIVAGNLGTHSIRKGAATHCAKCGVSKDHIELRGRWRGHKKQVDTYIDIERAFPDAQVAVRLCGPNGAARYSLINNSWCNASFLVNEIAPNTARILSPDIAKLLALPLMYAAVQGSKKLLRAIRATARIDMDADVPQFIDVIPIIPSGFDGELKLVDIGIELSDDRD